MMPTLTVPRHVLRVADHAVARAHGVYTDVWVSTGEEVDAAVIDGPRSAVWQQAANRLPTEQALIHALITGDWDGSA